MTEDFICPFCNELKDWASQMTICAATPDNCDGIIAGMPYKELGFCQDCVNEGL